MIIKNLLPKVYANKLNGTILGLTFPWYWSSDKIIRTAPDNQLFQFAHRLVTNSKGVSQYSSLIDPILFFLRKKTSIKIKNIVRIKTNLIPRTVTSDEWEYNVIHQDAHEEGNFISVIYYVHDCDGDTTIYADDKKTIVDRNTPKKNSCYVLNSKTWHRATPPKENKRRVVINCIFEVESTDIKLIDYDDSLDNKLDTFLESIGTKNMPHQKEHLYDHLMRTYFLAKDTFKDDTIALIGGLHSVYGTTAYKNKCLPHESTLVKDTFGDKVDKYVRMFGSINRQLLEEPDGSINDEDLYILRCVEVANLYDQQSLDKRLNLLSFAKQHKKGDLND